MRTRLLFGVCKSKARSKGGTLWEKSAQQIQDVTGIFSVKLENMHSRYRMAL